MADTSTLSSEQTGSAAATGSHDAAALQLILAKLRALGLNERLIEQETIGYTTLKGVLNDAQIARARQVILNRVERTTGTRLDIEHDTGEHLQGVTCIPYVLFDDEIYESILLAPKPLALITYLLGESCLLSPYSRAAGALAMVPGRHRLARQPTRAEMSPGNRHANPHAVYTTDIGFPIHSRTAEELTT